MKRSFTLRPAFRALLIALAGSVLVTNCSAQTPPVLLQMIRDEAVHKELGLSDAEIQQVRAAHAAVDGRWWRSRNMPAAEQEREIATITAELDQSIRGILNQGQQQRLDQLRRQALGTRMFTQPDVIESLSIDPKVVTKLKEAFLATDQKAISLQTQLRKGEKTSQRVQAETESAKQAEKEMLKGALTDQQRSMIASLIGTPFDFAQVKRTYPLAPELADAGTTWVQGGPVKLEELRGKVVAVHFYAYQCSNCIANIPHYNAWYHDLADQGLEVIGIQTPETSAESVSANVARAAKHEGIEYPVLLDGSRSNWDAWHNTMWPTVYLVDKQGFIRRWWHGEMNWKGTPGEKQMRSTIENLLAEE